MRKDFFQRLERVRIRGLEGFSSGPSAGLEEDLIFLLESRNRREVALLREAACTVRKETSGERLVVRGLVEFSSYCRNSCQYCGLNRGNLRAVRYRLSAKEILKAAGEIYQSGIKTIVLQSGEDPVSARKLAEVIALIKARYDMAVTLSVGEVCREDYRLWREAGADRYLLRIESSHSGLYSRLHMGRRVETRLRCLENLQELGYQTGSSLMVGVPGQTVEILAQDILFLGERNFDMLGIGPFIPHPDTPLAGRAIGSLELTMNVLSLVRLLARKAWMPATTAVGSLNGDARGCALRSGANVVMPNFSPPEVRSSYGIYPGKRCIEERPEQLYNDLERLAREAKIQVDYSRADGL